MAANLPDDDLFEAFQVEKTGLSHILPDGNAVLILGQRRFLVSSGILSAASPRFAALFHSASLEGTQFGHSRRPEMELPDTDPYALWIILAVIHYHKTDVIKHHKPTPKQLSSIAIQCSKFDCVEALSPWIDCLQQASMRNLPFSSAALTGADVDEYHKEYAYKLVAAHHFRHGPSFKKISKKAILNLPVSFNNHWQSAQMKDITQYLPNSLLCKWIVGKKSHNVY